MYNLKISENRQFPPRTTLLQRRSGGSDPVAVRAPELSPDLDAGPSRRHEAAPICCLVLGPHDPRTPSQRPCPYRAPPYSWRDAIARQEQIVAELEQLGQAGLEQKARQVLATFRELQNAYLRDLGRLRREIEHEGLESSDDRAGE